MSTNSTCSSCVYGSYESRDVHIVEPASTALEACLFALPISP